MKTINSFLAVCISSYILVGGAIVAAGIDTYNGLFAATNNTGATVVDLGSSGMISHLGVSQNGHFAGKLILTGAGASPSAATVTLRGVLNASGHAQTTVNFQNVSVVVDMTVDSANGTITGTVSESTGLWIAPLLAQRAVSSADVTLYDMLIPTSDSSGATAPPGTGYATVKNTYGRVAFTGFLADGTRYMSAPSQISSTGDVPLFVYLYRGQGVLQGWINLASGSPTGTLTWIKSANGTVPYPDGFTSRDIAIQGSPCNAPDASPAIPVTGGTLTISGADLGTMTFTVNGTTSNGNCLEVVGSNTAYTVKASVNPQAGNVMLKITPPKGSRPMKVIAAPGAILQNTTTVAGSFVHNGQAGAFMLTP